MKNKNHISLAFIFLLMLIIFGFNYIINQEKTAQEIIKNIYSVESLNLDIDKNYETAIRDKYSKFFTEKGLKLALSNRVFTSFPAIINMENIKNIECLGTQLKNTNHENEYNYTTNLKILTDTETVTKTITGIIRFENSTSKKIDYINTNK